MKAAICTKYGAPEVLQIREIAQPVPKDNEILIKIRATTVASGDCRIRGLRAPFYLKILMRLIFGLTKPRKSILGTELSGEVEAVGKNVKRFAVGDDVFAMTGMKFGTQAAYICLKESDIIAQKPQNISHEEASCLSFGGTTSLHYFRKAKMQKGSKILIYGASGAVGTSAIQIAKAFGAEVTGVCSASNLAMIKELGADHVIDYKKEDFSKIKERYDIVFDAVGKTSKTECKHLLKKDGSFISVSVGLAQEKLEDLLTLKKLVEDGKLKAVIDRVYSLEQIVDAYRYVDQGHKKGNVVITVNSAMPGAQQ